MKKLINLTWITVILICIGLTACSDNDDEQQAINIELLYGDWFYDGSDYKGEYYEMYTFNEGGFFELYWEEYDIDGELTDYGQETGRWEYNNGKLMFPYEGDIVTATIVSLNNNTLTLGNPQGETMTLYRAID